MNSEPTTAPANNNLTRSVRDSTGPTRSISLLFYYRKVFTNPTSRSTRGVSMSTDRQIEANRLNAQHSTGPSTPEGRAAVRLNGLKHGLCAETIVVPGEDPAQFEAMLEAYRVEYQPATPSAEFLVRQVAMADWRLLRL